MTKAPQEQTLSFTQKRHMLLGTDAFVPSLPIANYEVDEQATSFEGATHRTLFQRTEGLNIYSLYILKDRWWCNAEEVQCFPVTPPNAQRHVMIWAGRLGWETVRDFPAKSANNMLPSMPLYAPFKTAIISKLVEIHYENPKDSSYVYTWQ